MQDQGAAKPRIVRFGGSAVTLIGVPRVAFQFPRTEGLEWLNLTSPEFLNGIIFLPHQLRTANTNIMMGLVIHHDLEARGGIYLLVNSVGGSLQAALGLHD
mgnify:FL=1